MDAGLAIPMPKKFSYQEGAAIGVGTEVGNEISYASWRGSRGLTGEQTASLGLYGGLKLQIPDPKALPEVKDEWIVILGGAGSVGQYAVQVREGPQSTSAWRNLIKSFISWENYPATKW